MKKFLLLILLSQAIAICKTEGQKKYGYAILKFRCGDDDPQRDRVYFSPVIELDRLNFPKYTAGIDTTIALYSVRYYNYAISKWFEIYLKEKYNVVINTKDKYARGSNSVVYNDQNKIDCNPLKTNQSCFFTNEQELSTLRKAAITESRLAQSDGLVCGVINL